MLRHTLCIVFLSFRWIGTVLLYSYHKGQFDCNGKGVLHIYLIGLLVVLALIILSLCAIVYVSAQGKPHTIRIILSVVEVDMFS